MRWPGWVLVGMAALAGVARAEEADGERGRAAALFEATSERSFADVEHWTKIFDDPERDQWQRPAEVVKALGLAAGMTVADLGAGTGYFLPYLSAAVGEEGCVFAVEAEPNLVVHLRERAEKSGAANVVPVLASKDHARLPPASVDLVLIVDTFHHLDERLSYLRRLRRALKGGGRIAVVDWFKRPLPKGPPPEHKLARAQVVEEMEAAGYRLTGEPKILDYQYFLIFAPADDQLSRIVRGRGVAGGADAG